MNKNWPKINPKMEKKKNTGNDKIEHGFNFGLLHESGYKILLASLKVWIAKGSSKEPLLSPSKR